jgi:hypothetical protein
MQILGMGPGRAKCRRRAACGPSDTILAGKSGIRRQNPQDFI